MIALVVSQLNDCDYGITRHRRGLRRLLRDDELAGRIESDYRNTGLDARHLIMLCFAEKLTRRPSQIQRADVEALRAAGFDDPDILGVVEVISYYAYVNRIAEG